MFSICKGNEMSTDEGKCNCNVSDFTRFVSESATWDELIQKCRYKGRRYRCTVYIEKRAKKLGLSLDHLQGRCRPRRSKISNEEVFVENSTYIGGIEIKKRLMKDFGFKWECSVCKITEWQGKPITLELEHKNGIHTDNRIENLTFLCPNCHSQTDTYRAKNRIKVEKAEKDKFQGRCEDCDCDIFNIEGRCMECHKKHIQSTRKFTTARKNKECPGGCGKIIQERSKTCKECYAKSILSDKKPPDEELLDAVSKNASWRSLAKKYGASTNTVKNWVKWASKSK